MQKYLPLSLLGVNTISEASLCVCSSDGGIGGGEGVTVGAVMITAFERKAATFTSSVDSPESAQTSLPLLRNGGTERPTGCAELSKDAAPLAADSSSRDSATGSIFEGEDAGRAGRAEPVSVAAPARKRAGWSITAPSSLPVSDRMRDSDEERDDSENDSHRVRAVASVDAESDPFERQEGESLYADPSVPLSLFFQEGVMPSAPPGGPSVKRILPAPTVSRDDKAKYDAAEKEEKERAAGCKMKGSWETPSRGKTGKLVDLPVIFQPQLRSSGYGQAQAVEKKPILVRKLSSSTGRLSDRSTSTTNSGTRSQSSGGSSGSRIRIYPGTCDPMSLHQPYNDYPVQSTSGSSASLPSISSITFRSVKSSRNMFFSCDGSL